MIGNNELEKSTTGCGDLHLGNNSFAPENSSSDEETGLYVDVDLSLSVRPPPPPHGTTLLRRLQMFMPSSQTPLLIIGRVMDYYPLFKYVNSEQFKKDLGKNPNSNKSPLLVSSSVGFDFAARIEYVQSYVRKLFGSSNPEYRIIGKETALLLYFFGQEMRNKHSKPYTWFVYMLREGEKRFDFKYSESVSLIHLTQEFPGFLFYKLNMFEE